MANIRTARRSGFVLRGGRQRRETRWGTVPTGEVTLSGAPSVAIVTSLTADFLALRPFTIIRVRGMMSIHPDQIVATEDYSVSYGWAVVSEQAATIGVTAVPTPVADRDSDLWFVYESLIDRVHFGSDTGFRSIGIRKEFDSKAMRKVEDGENVVTVVENELAGATVITMGRFLIKLH